MSGDERTSGFDLFFKGDTGIEGTVHWVSKNGETPAEVVEAIALAHAALKARGFVRTDRLEQRGYGGGGGGKGRPGSARPEDPAPADRDVPEHCGLPMIYRPAKPETENRKAVSERWECRKGAACEEAEERGGNRYGKTDWHAHLKKPSGESSAKAQPAKAPKADAQASQPQNGQPAASSAKPTSQRLTAFWKEARQQMGYTTEMVEEIAGAPVATLTNDQLNVLQQRLVDAYRIRVGAAT